VSKVTVVARLSAPLYEVRCRLLAYNDDSFMSNLEPHECPSVLEWRLMMSNVTDLCRGQKSAV
jgi:hypothetical protein